ncbi:MAG: DUF5678 domain-containing protein [archaeon]
MDNYQFFMKTNVNQFVGQWIAVCDKKIVSHGKSAKKVFEQAQKECPGKKPLLTKVPDKETMIF